MKKHLFTVIITTVSLGLIGCGDSTRPAADGATGDAQSVMNDAAKAAAPAVEGAAKAAQNTANQAATAANDAAGSLGGKVSEALANAQKLLSEGKLQEAKDALNPLAGLQLTADQQKLVADLKARIEQAITAAKSAGGDATKALQGVIPKK